MKRTSHVGVCRLDGDSLATSLTEATLGNRDLLLFRLDLDGSPHAVVLRSICVGRDKVNKELLANRDRARKAKLPINKPVMLQVTGVPKSASDCGVTAAF